MKILVTGGCGFLGSNLCSEALIRNIDLAVFDNLFRLGSHHNLQWLKQQGDFKYYHGDIRNFQDISRVVCDFKPDAIFHLAGQVAMTTSISNPHLDFEINAIGTHNVLESVRLHQPNASILYSSTNKVYGDLDQYHYEEKDTRYSCIEKPTGFDESTSLDFRSPYGCSKGCADQYVLDYARIFGLKSAVFRHSSMFGGRQYATYDQGWIGWFCQKAVEIKRGILKTPFTISGNGKQVRDVLYADDMVSLYFSALDKIDLIAGQAYNIGGGFENSLSLLELFKILENSTEIKMTYTTLPVRQSDQKVFIADINKIQSINQWKPQISKIEGINKMLHWIQKQNEQC